MSVLLDSFVAAFDNLTQRDAAELGEHRRAALEAAVRDGLPSSRSEAWKYTSLRALERHAFQPAPTISDGVRAALAMRIAEIPAPRMVFVDGWFDAINSDVVGLAAGIDAKSLARVLREGEPRDANFMQRHYGGSDEAFATINAALAEEGATIRLDHGAIAERPFHLVFITTGTEPRTALHLRHFIDLRNDASMTLVEHHLALGEHDGLCNHVTHIHLGQRAKLQHIRIQHEADNVSAFARCDAVLARDALYQRADLELGATLSRHELNVRLEGEGASLVANGVMFADGKRHLDTRLGIEHIARDTTSELLWRGLGSGRGRVVFHGGITIRQGADGSDANLSSKNLLLSAQSEIDAQPVLVIHADEVKAAHGATVGQLDPTALFYLRSRGLPDTTARAILTAAFCRETLAGISDPDLRAWLEQLLDAALARVADV